MAMTGLSDRQNRRLIKRARENGAKIVSSSDRRGYYMASLDTEWILFLNEHRGRAQKGIELYKKGMKMVTKSELL